LTIENLKRTLHEIQKPEVAARQIEGFQEISDLLGGDDCISRTAELILNA